MKLVCYIFGHKWRRAFPNLAPHVKSLLGISDTLYCKRCGELREDSKV